MKTLTVELQKIKMNGLDLTKSQKKIARAIIEKGLQVEYVNGIKKLKKIIHAWEEKKVDNRKAYLDLYRALIKHDKHIGRRYDNMTGSTYLYIISGQLTDEVISIEDLKDLDEEIKQKIYFLSGINDE
jgi:predicted naringenin-chalcone synthase